MRVRLLLVASLMSLTACASLPGVDWLSHFSAFSPYKIDIQQGNYLDPKAIAQLKLGMTKPQVQFIMGSSLISDPFRPEKWDYIYDLQRDEKTVERERLELTFVDGKLTQIDNNLNDIHVKNIPTKNPTPVTPNPNTAPAAPSPSAKPTVTPTPAVMATPTIMMADASLILMPNPQPTTDPSAPRTPKNSY